MITSGNSFEDNTSDAFINEAIKLTLENLKINPPKFEAVFENSRTEYFDTYEEAMTFLSQNPTCKVYII